MNFEEISPNDWLSLSEFYPTPDFLFEGISTEQSQTSLMTPMLPDTKLPISKKEEGEMIYLENAPLWRLLNKANNEMMYTISGRKLYPSLQFKASQLEKMAYYLMAVDLVDQTGYTWKFDKKDQTWIPRENKRSPPGSSQLFIHPASPQPGSHWEKQSIHFDHLRIQSQKEKENIKGFQVLSGHKYLPRLHLIKLQGFEIKEIKIFHFDILEFIASTHYRNPLLSDMKVLFNAHASGMLQNRTIPAQHYELIHEMIEKSRAAEFYEKPSFVGPKTTSDLSLEDLTSIQKMIEHISK